MQQRKKKNKWSTRIKWGLFISTIALILGLISDAIDLYERLFATPTPTPHSSQVTAPVTQLEDITERVNLSSITEFDDMEDVFPFFVGATWFYNYTELSYGSNDPEDETERVLGQYSEKVISIETVAGSSVRIIHLKTDGQNYPSDCAGLSSASGELWMWYVVDKKNLYLACSQEEAYQIVNGLLSKKENELLSGPRFRLPLEIGATWPFDSGGGYQWEVLAKEDVRIPAGKIENCYQVALFTLPDHTIKWICPGFGLVASEYAHHPPIYTYRAELLGFEVNIGN